MQASSEEVSVYNLYTDNLTAKYVTAFSDPPLPLSRVGSFWIFDVRSSAFDEPLEQLYPINVK